MREAQRLVREARAAHGKKRYDLLVKAARIVVALREPRIGRAAFQRTEWALEVAIGKLGGCAGCLAMRVSRSHKRPYVRVKRAIDKADPIGLLRLGAPRDEYHPEIDDIALGLPRCRTLEETWTMVHRTFVKWFTASVAGRRNAYLRLARELHALPGRCATVDGKRAR